MWEPKGSPGPHFQDIEIFPHARDAQNAGVSSLIYLENGAGAIEVRVPPTFREAGTYRDLAPMPREAGRIVMYGARVNLSRWSLGGLSWRSFYSARQLPLND
jgi:hypothetical protein